MDRFTAYTDRQALSLKGRIGTIYGKAQSSMLQSLKRYMRPFRTDLTGREYQSWLRANVFSQKWSAEELILAGMLIDADKESMAAISSVTVEVLKENANFIGKKLGLSIYDMDAVNRLLKEHPELLPRRIVNGQKAAAWHKKNIAQAVAIGIIKGETVEELSERIARDTGMKAGRSSMLYARTALTCAQNAGRFQRMQEAEEQGAKLLKVWLTVKDERVRTAHKELHNKAVPLNEPFVNSLGEIMYPGDLNAAPGNVWNCRCVLGYKGG